MIIKLASKVASDVRAFHDDESGEGVVGSISVGAVGVLLAALVFSVMSGVMQNQGGDMFGSILSGIGSVAGGFLGF